MTSLQRLALPLFAFTAMASASAAQSFPTLSETDLYTKTAHDCKRLDLTLWHHPVRHVLEKNGVVLKKLELCNNGRFPIFTVQLKYDPASPGTDAFYNKLDAEIAKANGWWSYAMVDESFNEAITVIVRKTPPSHSLEIDMEQYGSGS